MFEKSLFRSLAAAALLVSAAGGATIETVPVGNPGNLDDTHGDGYGGVAEPYRIGKYEVTAGQYAEFLNAVAVEDTYGLYSTNMESSDYGCKIVRSGSPGNYSYAVAADRRDRPVNYVSWGNAARFANWLHNGRPTGAQDNSTTEDGAYLLNGATSRVALMAVTRRSDATWFLPTEDQWYKAAYYDGARSVYYDYPTGTDDEPDNGNPDGDTGNTATFFDGDYTVSSLEYTTPVGHFGLSGSPYGTFDQGGNLWEWNESVIATGSTRGLRGGCRYDYSDKLSAAYRSGGNGPTSELSSIGFRVASVPEPGSLTLMGCGLVAGSIWWGRRDRGRSVSRGSAGAPGRRPGPPPWRCWPAGRSGTWGGNRPPGRWRTRSS